MKSTLCAGLLGLTLLAGCTQTAEQIETNLSKSYAVKVAAAPAEGLAPLPETPTNEEDIAQANNAFSLRLFQKLAALQPDSNIFCSPLNVSTAFSQLYLGSANKTTEAISQTFGWKDNSAPHHQSLNSLLAKLTSKKDGPTINIANKLWLSPSFTVFPEYTERLKKFYAAELFSIDFSNNVAAAKAINDWVALKTEKKITELLKPDQIASTTKFVITSAIYFKADWATPFKKEDSKNETFYGAQPKDVNMMHKDFGKSAKYLELDSTKVLALPYTNSRLAAYFILPAEDMPLASFTAALQPEFFATILAAPSLEFDYVRTTLPSWRVEYNQSLYPILAEMGLNKSPELDLAAMTPAQKLAISVVQHNAFVEVNEQGTEAAAATAVVVKDRSVSIQPKLTVYEFIANRPFLYFIADEETNTILFIGSIVGL